MGQVPPWSLTGSSTGNQAGQRPTRLSATGDGMRFSRWVRKALVLAVGFVVTSGVMPTIEAGAAPDTDPARWVNPFVGTRPGGADLGTGGGAGNTFPGAVAP